MSVLTNPAAMSRNLTLDFFRGVALLIIFINHVPANEALLFTPSRFGLSDAAEIFVFASGFAAALAYGKTFRSAGIALGSLRVFHRCGQIYTAHLALFGLMAVTCVLGNSLLDTRDYITQLNIRYFFDETEEALRSLLALRYVPHYFDILPMYLVIMLWIPGVLAVAQISRGLAMTLPVGVYLAMWVWDLEFLADPVGDRPWFFNPFGWQLIFFIGFGFGAGWLRPPPPMWTPVLLSLAIIALSLPLSPEPALRPTVWLQDLHATLLPWLEKTRFGPLRLVHFLALAYLASVVFRGPQVWLTRPAGRLIVQMGQQSLPIFTISMVLSYVGGMVFDLVGHHPLSIVAINLGGIATLILCGALLAWLKSSPWKRLDPMGNAAGSSATGEGGLWPADDISWWRWVERGAAVAVVLAVSASPILLGDRRSAPPAPSDVILAGDEWTAARVSFEGSIAPGVGEPP
ncbi:OpgC family protein [Methylotetracoccus oryzae]|uniref:OpgC family protein n=1 Tax=Methylotetracoccus oryzae TaxID=1919059 RepID=UPI0011194D26|nr:OpgC domain-containing protein [Methylotetracoccus oryzae]